MNFHALDDRLDFASIFTFVMCSVVISQETSKRSKTRGVSNSTVCLSNARRGISIRRLGNVYQTLQNIHNRLQIRKNNNGNL